MFQVDLLKVWLLFKLCSSSFQNCGCSKTVLAEGKSLISFCRRIGETFCSSYCCSLFSEAATQGVLLKKKKLQHKCFPAKFATFLKIPIFKNICERLLLHFHYNSHHHYHYHHFPYHCEMQVYRRRIYLTIPLDCNMIPCLFQLNFIFFLPAYIFVQSYPKFFVFYGQ